MHSHLSAESWFEPCVLGAGAPPPGPLYLHNNRWLLTASLMKSSHMTYRVYSRDQLTVVFPGILRCCAVLRVRGRLGQVCFFLGPSFLNVHVLGGTLSVKQRPFDMHCWIELRTTGLIGSFALCLCRFHFQWL